MPDTYSILVGGARAKLKAGRPSVIRKLLKVRDPQYFYKQKAAKNKDGKLMYSVSEFIDFYDPIERTFPSGFVPRVVNYLSKVGEKVHLSRMFEGYKDRLDPEMLYGITLRDYQLRILSECMRKGFGTIASATGSGKGLIISALVKLLGDKGNLPAIIFVPNINLLKQQADVMKKSLPQMKVGMVGNGKKQLNCDVIVCTPQTMRQALPPKQTRVKIGKKWVNKISPYNPKFEHLLKKTKLLILDECHHGGSDTWFNLAGITPARFRFGFSGTVGKGTKFSNMRLEGAVGPKIYEVKNKELIDKKILARPTVYLIDDDRVFGKTVPFTELDAKTGKMVRRPYAAMYKDAITDNHYYNVHIAKIAKHLVKLGKPPLITCTRLEHMRNIKESCKYAHVRSKILSGKDPLSVRRAVVAEFVRDKNFCLIASNIFDEGLDIPPLSAIILAAGGKSQITLFQRIGRGLRKKKDNRLIVVDFAHSNNKYTIDHAIKRGTALIKDGMKLVHIEDVDTIIVRIK